jgi:hypothetical protein
MGETTNGFKAGEKKHPSCVQSSQGYFGLE